MPGSEGGGLLSLIANSPVDAWGVLALCAIGSLLSWFIIAAKWWEFRGYAERGAEFERVIERIHESDGRLQATAHLAGSPWSSLMRVCSEFMTDLNSAMARNNVQRSGLSLTQLEALTLTLDAEVRRAAETAGSKLQWLAVIGSTAPLLGLFGTVLGIIRAFQDIAGGEGASLQVVGPGIAAALVATAAGLLAAIPAVMAYNLFQARTERLEGSLERLAQELIGRLGREGKL